MTILPNYAGLREYRKARSTGTHVGLYDGEEAGLDTDGGRWSTICEEHGYIVAHTTLALARENMPHPEEWCDPCQDSKWLASRSEARREDHGYQAFNGT